MGKTQIIRDRREELRTTGIQTYWCVIHNGQSDTGAAWCLRRRAYDGRPVALENYERPCEILDVDVRREF